jgi:hypothetical protein
LRQADHSNTFDRLLYDTIVEGTLVTARKFFKKGETEKKN